MDDRGNELAAKSEYMTYANGFNGQWLPLERLAGRRLTKKVMACLERGLAEEREQVLAGSSECQRQEAEARADLALMAVGLLQVQPDGQIKRAGGLLTKVNHWQVEQARALIHLSIDELCQEALWRLESLPEFLVEDVMNRSLRVTPGEPAVLPVTVSDFWNTGLFVSETITAARMLECRSRVLEWQDKRSSHDPRVLLAYLRTLETRLREREDALSVRRFLCKVEAAIPLWKEGYQLGEDFFRCDEQVEGGMRTSLHVMAQHLYEIQRDQEFPWRAVIDEKALGTVWQENDSGSSAN
ncbi:hypothetical protein M3P05_14060 [Sansalvadorimonas sp. 2012CJ34-2]|uniref:Uncharacterized protein n=1 Tax=Parendozoicomonas callyspongiae TaxID=2942213 RepID=A0ABT0PI44_9GAMM|nr:hypothetical protein [Sansalvadorimonas sp. 2012CJ34-2]MCL6271052.1 hypothetical protein [Sansalvadorimonas sp. 2012CJ34-2]